MYRLTTVPSPLVAIVNGRPIRTTVQIDVDPASATGVARLVETGTDRPVVDSAGLSARWLAIADQILGDWALVSATDRRPDAAARVYAPVAGWTTAGWREVFGPMLEDGVLVAA